MWINRIVQNSVRNKIYYLVTEIDRDTLPSKKGGVLVYRKVREETWNRIVRRTNGICVSIRDSIRNENN